LTCWPFFSHVNWTLRLPMPWDTFTMGGVSWSYARKLVTAISGGVFDLLYPVLERDSVDDLGELV